MRKNLRSRLGFRPLGDDGVLGGLTDPVEDGGGGEGGGGGLGFAYIFVEVVEGSGFPVEGPSLTF